MPYKFCGYLENLMPRVEALKNETSAMSKDAILESNSQIQLLAQIIKYRVAI